MIIPRRLWKSIAGTLLAAGAVVVFGALGLVLAALLPSLPGYKSLIVYGGSMAPFLHIGDVAVIQPVSPEDVQIGDVVTYRGSTNPQALVTHRITNIKAQDGVLAFETKGDASPNVDYWSVTEDTVVGQVIYTVPFVGYLCHFGQGLPGRLLLVGLPALLLVIETSQRKRNHPSQNDRPIPKVDDPTEPQEVTSEVALADISAVLVDQTAQGVSGTGGWMGPLPDYHCQRPALSEHDLWFIARYLRRRSPGSTPTN